MIVAMFVLAPSMAHADSMPKTALIDGESVTTEDGIEKEGVPISLEQYAAEHAGYTVTVRSGSEWEAMSAEEFGKYQLLIVGDPKCSSTAASAVNSAHTWTPVVMGSLTGAVGNRTVVGTDPEYHYVAGGGGAQPKEAGNPSSAGAEHLVQDGIAFAGGVPGATGVYFDTSCSDLEEGESLARSASRADVHRASTPLQEEIEGPDGRDKTEVLDKLTQTSEVWEEDSEPPCGGNVQQIATTPTFDEGETKLLDSDIEGWSCSVHVSFPHFPADWFAIAVATDTATHPTCGTDPETKEEACGEAYVLLAGRGIVAEAPNLALTPASASAPAGGNHTVVANVHKEGKPIVSVVVSFVVTGQNGGVSGSCTTGGGAPDPECRTDENGEVAFTYSDTKGAGEDTIIGSVTLESEEATIAAKPAAARVVLTTERASATMDWTPVPAPPTVPKSTPIATPATVTAKSEVLSFGSAHLASSARACVASTGYLASVSGKEIASVTYTLDGHKLKTLSKPNSHGVFALRVHVASGHAHHLAMKVVFAAASHTSSVTLHKTLARCAAVKRVVTPRFTG